MKRILALRLNTSVAVTVLAIMYLCIIYAMYALKLFPSHDGYNIYIHTFYPLINSLLQGRIMLWDPLAACGWPFFFTFIMQGVLEPMFAVAVLLGKLFLLNVLQTYWIWIMLRNIPVLIGTYWLMRQYCRHSIVTLLTTAFFFSTISFCLLRDHIIFIIYWPLLLAILTYFCRSLARSRVSIPSFLGVIFFLGLSFQLYNPVYTVILISAIAFSRCIVAPKSVVPFIKSLRLIKFRYWIVGTLIMMLFLCPLIIILINYRSGDYFAYIRTHQAAADIFHTISCFFKDSLDYVEVNPEGSPVRSLWELASCVFPFYYAGPERMEGTVYFGFLGLLGILAGFFFRRNKVFLTYFLSSLFIVFLMSPFANGFLWLMSPLPFLKMLNQRHLLYPAFLICITIASCIGLESILEYRLMRKIAQYVSPGRVLFVGIILLVCCFLFLWLGGVSTTDVIKLGKGIAPRLYVVFLLSIVGIALFLRLSVRNPKLYYLYILFISTLFLVDLSFSCRDLSKYYHRNRGVLAKSQILRRRLDVRYQPYRAPLLPIMYGTEVNSIVHLMDLRTALPAYWHTDIIFTLERYYYLFSSLSPTKLKHIVGIDTPIIRTFTKSALIGKGESALLEMQKMGDDEVLDTVVLEETKRISPRKTDSIEKIIFVGQSTSRKLLRGFAYPEEIDKSFYMTLYDSLTLIPVDRCEEVSYGVYHQRMFRIPFDLQLPTTPEGEIDISRCFFPDFPYLSDIDGNPYYFSKGMYLTGNPRDRQNKSVTLMRPTMGRGILLELQGDKPVFPRKVYFQKDRLPLPLGVHVVSFDPNRVEILTEQEQDSILYYGDLYDKNWKARIDGQPGEILIANYAFKAVKLPVGKHRVVFEYKVPYLILALSLYYLCIISFIAGLIYLWVLRMANSRHSSFHKKILQLFR